MVGKPFRLILAILVIFAPCRSFSASLNTEQLEAICQAGLDDPNISNPKYSFCLGIGLGIAYADTMDTHKMCAPLDLDGKTTLRTFLSYAQATRDKKIDGFVTFYRALLAAFPCRK